MDNEYLYIIFFIYEINLYNNFLYVENVYVYI